MLGYYKSERNEVTGATRPVALRDGTKYSVILGVFANDGYDATVSLAQVFWLRGADAAGQPDRFYVTADRPLSVAGDFADFGSDMTALRRRLRAAPGVRVTTASRTTARISAAVWASSRSRRWSCSTRRSR